MSPAPRSQQGLSIVLIGHLHELRRLSPCATPGNSPLNVGQPRPLRPLFLDRHGFQRITVLKTQAKPGIHDLPGTLRRPMGSMQRITAVHGHVTGSRLQLKRWHIQTLILARNLDIRPVRARDHTKGTAAFARPRHRDPRGQTVAEIRMTALAAILVPGKIRQPRLDIERLDESFRSQLSAIECVSSQAPKPLEAPVPEELPKNFGALMKEENPNRLRAP